MSSERFRALHDALSATWARVWVFVVDEGVDSGERNIILLATDGTLTAAELRARIADCVGGRVTVPAFHLFGDDLHDVGTR